MERFNREERGTEVTFNSLNNLLKSALITKPKIESPDCVVYETDFNPNRIQWLEEVQRSARVEITTEELGGGKFRITLENLDV